LALQQTTILLATHNFAEAAAVADRLLLLHRGELLANRPVERAKTLTRCGLFYFRMTGEIDEKICNL